MRSVRMSSGERYQREATCGESYLSIFYLVDLVSSRTLEIFYRSNLLNLENLDDSFSSMVFLPMFSYCYISSGMVLARPKSQIFTLH